MRSSKTLTFLSFSILLFIFAGCNKDDAPVNPEPDPVNNVPSAFEISVSDITYNSAKINWTASTSEEPTTILYSVYLNDALLAENLTETSYHLEELSDSTNYNVMVKAANEFGENDTTKDFTTLPQRKLLLKEYIYPNGKISKIEYNEDSQVSLKYFTYNPDLNTKYTYIDGNISTDIYNHSIEGSRAIYTYNADQRLTHLKTVEFGSHYSIRCLYDFESNTNYVYTHETSVDYDLITYNYSVNLILNDEGNIVKYERLDLDSSQLDTATFEYTNGNMTYIKSRTNASWEITYDDNMSFHTYASGFPRIDFRNGAKYDVAGLLYHKDLHFETLDFPQFYRFLNKNNPLEYKVNGEVITTFEYEYNEDNYPISIKANFKDGTTTGVIKLNYEEP